jgi:hypothetical protein
MLGLDAVTSLDATVSAQPQSTFLALNADPVAAFLGLDTAFLALDADPVLGLDPVPAFLALDPVPSLSRSLPFLGEFTNHLFLCLFVAWVLSPFC